MSSDGGWLTQVQRVTENRGSGYSIREFLVIRGSLFP
jgi:hypothetical protein